MSKTPAIPKTFDEFYANWDGWIDGAIEKVSRGRINRNSEEAEDTKQQVYYRILQQKHIEKFDPEKGSFTHHIYRVVLHVLSNKWDKDTRTPTANAIPVVETPTEDPTLLGALVLEQYVDAVDEAFARQLEVRDYLDQFERFLARESKPWDTPIQLADGSMRRKSLALVFQMLRRSMEPKEIASQLRVTTSSIHSYIQKIKALAERFKTSEHLCV